MTQFWPNWWGKGQESVDKSSHHYKSEITLPPHTLWEQVVTNPWQLPGNRSLMLRTSSQSSHWLMAAEPGTPKIVRCKCPAAEWHSSALAQGVEGTPEPLTQESSLNCRHITPSLKQILKPSVLYLTGLLIPLLGMYTWTLRSDNGLVHAAFVPKTKNPNAPARACVVCSSSGRLRDWSPVVYTERNMRTSWALSCFLLQLGEAQSSRKDQSLKEHTSILVMGRQVFYKQYQQSPHLTFQNRTWQGRHMQESCTNLTLR